MGTRASLCPAAMPMMHRAPRCISYDVARAEMTVPITRTIVEARRTMRWPTAYATGIAIKLAMPLFVPPCQLCRDVATVYGRDAATVGSFPAIEQQGGARSHEKCRIRHEGRDVGIRLTDGFVLGDVEAQEPTQARGQRQANRGDW